jgi:hypothetical protein
VEDTVRVTVMDRLGRELGLELGFKLGLNLGKG